MPFYEYRCDTCGHELEAMQKMRDAALTDCPKCGNATLVKLISAAGFRLKGSGWYETDFKNNGSNKKTADSDSSSKPTETSSKPVESKAASCSAGDSPAC